MQDYLSQITDRTSDLNSSNTLVPFATPNRDSITPIEDPFETNEQLQEVGTQPMNKNILPAEPSPILKQQKTISNSTVESSYLTRHIIRSIEIKKEDQTITEGLLQKPNTSLKINDYRENIIPKGKQSPNLQKNANIPKDEVTQKTEVLIKNVIPSQPSATEFPPNDREEGQLKKLEPMEVVVQKERDTRPITKLIPQNENKEQAHQLKPAPSSPKLVIGRITVEIVKPAPQVVKVFEKKQVRSSAGDSVKNMEINKFRFGLSQL